MNLERAKTNNSTLTTLKQNTYKVLKEIYRRIQRTNINPIPYLDEQIKILDLKLRVQHIYGPLQIDYAENELIVTCLVRNGEIYINSFIRHYLDLGVKHIIFLDNGSTDKTVEIAKSYSNVTVLQTLRPYRKYETVMKKYLVNRFSKGRWNLFVDIDELFDYPFSDQLSLSNLLKYLNANSYTAVVSQMLDMFSDERLSDLYDGPSDDIKSKYSYYDISHIVSSKYRWGQLSNEKIKMHFGGIRKALFDTDNGLSKAALVFIDEKIKLFVDFHHVRNANIADFTCVLLHYPFTSQFYNKVMEAVKTDRYALSASHEYKKYWDKIRGNKTFTIKQNTSRNLDGLGELIEEDFLVVSEKYIQWNYDMKNT